MNATRTVMTSLVAGALLVGGGAVAAAEAAPWAAGTSSAVVAADTDLTRTLRFAREEERMARDLYRAFAEKYDAAPFTMIAVSEQRHFDLVGTLLDRYDVADPSAGKKAGSYADPTLQERYDGWLADGQKSLDAAYDVGVALEKRDIADLEDTVASVSQADAKQVFTMLLNASRHHLAAFQAAADGQDLGWRDGDGFGMGYGGGMGYGMGQGMGQGMGRHLRQGGGMMGGSFDADDCPMWDTTDS